jgi:hypothetical protein
MIKIKMINDTPRIVLRHQNDKSKLEGQKWERNNTEGLTAKINLNLRTHSDTICHHQTLVQEIYLKNKLYKYLIPLLLPPQLQ